jgi:hypothetical protein
LVRIVSPTTTRIRRPTLPKAHKKLPAKTITRWRETEDYPERGVLIQVDGEFGEYFHTIETGDKLGGWPYFVGAEYPKCPRCKQEMTEVVFQVGSNDNLAFSWGDGWSWPHHAMQAT